MKDNRKSDDFCTERGVVWPIVPTLGTGIGTKQKMLGRFASKKSPLFIGAGRASTKFHQRLVGVTNTNVVPNDYLYIAII